jgi:multidrug efflux system outer membrane protein
MKRRLALLGAAALLLASCTLGPNYTRPPVETPPAWRDNTALDNSIANLPWWEMFRDPVLEELIEIALAENRDALIAAERIVEARALYGFTKAELYPRVDLTGDGGYLRGSERGLNPPPEGADTKTDFYRLSADLAWEIDFFGRLRRATEAQYALFLSTEEARRAVVIALVSDVARTYVELRDLDRRLGIARRTLASREEYRELARIRFEGGVTSEIDFRQAEAEYHRVEGTVLDLERSTAQKENEISVLLGRNPGKIPRAPTVEEFPLPPAVPAGLPSDLIERRPDVRQAEEILIASNAQIGAAKALLFPRITLTGSFGFESTEIDRWLTTPAQAWSIGGSLLQPIFNAGQNRRRVEISESQQRQALYAYEKSIQAALRETEDAIVGYRKGGELRGSAGERARAERKVLHLAELRYRGGVAGYLDVLDAQRSLFSAELDESLSIRDHLISLIQLYKALGGGWTPEAPKGTGPSPAPGTRG